MSFLLVVMRGSNCHKVPLNTTEEDKGQIQDGSPLQTLSMESLPGGYVIHLEILPATCKTVNSIDPGCTLMLVSNC